MKPYPGQKKIYGLYHKIINEIPGHTVYYELFAGTAQIALLLYPLQMRLNTTLASTVTIILNDIDRSVTDKYNFTSGIEIQNRNAVDIIHTKVSVLLTI